MSAGNFYKGLDDMYRQDDLIKDRFTQNDSRADRAYMGWTGDDGHGPKGKVPDGRFELSIVVVVVVVRFHMPTYFQQDTKSLT